MEYRYGYDAAGKPTYDWATRWMYTRLAWTLRAGFVLMATAAVAVAAQGRLADPGGLLMFWVSAYMACLCCISHRTLTHLYEANVPAQRWALAFTRAACAIRTMIGYTSVARVLTWQLRLPPVLAFDAAIGALVLLWIQTTIRLFRAPYFTCKFIWRDFSVHVVEIDLDGLRQASARPPAEP
jgi:hypothetical protein